MLGLGVTVLMAVSVFIAELVDWRSDWADGNSERFGIAMSTLWLPFWTAAGPSCLGEIDS